jgi:hypothetical protein
VHTAYSYATENGVKKNCDTQINTTKLLYTPYLDELGVAEALHDEGLLHKVLDGHAARL